MSEHLKLYRVTLQGMTGLVGTNMIYGVSYVVATNSAEAYQSVREWLDKEDVGYVDDRELASVDLVADAARYPSCRIRLYLPEEE